MTEAASEAGSSDSGLKYLRYHLLRWSRVIIYIYRERERYQFIWFNVVIGIV